MTIISLVPSINSFFSFFLLVFCFVFSFGFDIKGSCLLSETSIFFTFLSLKYILSVLHLYKEINLKI